MSPPPAMPGGALVPPEADGRRAVPDGPPPGGSGRASAQAIGRPRDRHAMVIGGGSSGAGSPAQASRAAGEARLRTARAESKNRRASRVEGPGPSTPAALVREASHPNVEDEAKTEEG